MYHVPLWMGCAAFLLTFACATGAVLSRFSSKPIFFRLVLLTGPSAFILDILNLLISSGNLTNSLAEGIARIGLFISVGTACLYFLFSSIYDWISSDPCKPERNEKTVKTSEPVLLYGKPETGRINPSDLQNPTRKEEVIAMFDVISKELTTYYGCKEKDFVDATNNLLAYINKYDEPLWATPDFLLLVDGINGLLRVGTEYIPSKELQEKYIKILCSLAQDVIAERACKEAEHKQK